MCISPRHTAFPMLMEAAISRETGGHLRFHLSIRKSPVITLYRTRYRDTFSCNCSDLFGKVKELQIHTNLRVNRPCIGISYVSHGFHATTALLTDMP